jgi:threonine-phosphate decarboxylase
MLAGHGDDGYKHDRPVIADFSTNVWYGGAPDGLKSYLFDRWDKIERYPEVTAESLVRKIAESYDLPEDCILVANGSTESIYMIANAFTGVRTGITTPAFSEYEDACRMYKHNITLLPWHEVAKGDVNGLDLIFICNPNNPTGEIIRNLEESISNNRDTIFILDEAFIEFTYSFSSLIQMVTEYENLIVLRSMTKLYAIPGLRLGYLAAAPSLISRIKNFKLPWSVNSLAIQAGHFIFDHRDSITIPLETVLREKQIFMSALSGLGFTVYPSHTHFFLAETPIFNAAELKEYLLTNYDLLIRDAGNFRGLTDKYFRLATLSPDKNNLLINALTQWISISS